MKISRLNFVFIVVFLLLITTITIDGKKRKKNKSSSQVARSKTKTKWSSTMESPSNGESGASANSLLATEEHGYYVKRTFVAADGTLRTNLKENATTGAAAVPFLAIPIAWFPCPEDNACRNGYSAIFNTGLNAMSEGFLCDDDCTGPYEPICGKTVTEVAVFYNKCKLNVAKCRTHGYWIDYPLEECKKAYPKELEYTEKKFKSSAYFKVQMSAEVLDEKENKQKKNELPQIAATEAAGAAAAAAAAATSTAAKIGDKFENVAIKIEATKVKQIDVNDVNKNH